MSECKIIRQYGGSKSTVIRAMIQDNNKERIRKKADDIGFKSKSILKLINQIDKLTLEKDKISDMEKAMERKLCEECNKKGIKVTYTYNHLFSETDSFKNKKNFFTATDDICWIKEEDIDKLQLASNLWALGKKKDANTIWDKMINKYKLSIGE